GGGGREGGAARGDAPPAVYLVESVLEGVLPGRAPAIAIVGWRDGRGGDGRRRRHSGVARPRAFRRRPRMGPRGRRLPRAWLYERECLGPAWRRGAGGVACRTRQYRGGRPQDFSGLARGSNRSLTRACAYLGAHSRDRSREP